MGWSLGRKSEVDKAERLPSLNPNVSKRYTLSSRDFQIGPLPSNPRSLGPHKQLQVGACLGLQLSCARLELKEECFLGSFENIGSNCRNSIT